MIAVPAGCGGRPADWTWNMNKQLWIFATALLAACSAPVTGPAPTEDHSRVLQQGQYRAGMAHSELEQARYDARLAEQDVLNARDAHAAAQQQSAARKRELDAAEQAFAAARARLAAAQKAYDSAVNAVDAANRTLPVAPAK
jgi:hypothetical protein